MDLNNVVPFDQSNDFEEVVHEMAIKQIETELNSVHE